MTPVELILAKLPQAKKSGKGWMARCPAHKDQKPSLSIAEGDDECALLKCHAGCTTEAVVSKLGLTMRDLMPNGEGPATKQNGKPKSDSTGRTFASANLAVAELERRHGKQSKMWTYHDAAGYPVGLVLRWDQPDGKKDIRPVSLHPNGWRIAAMPGPRPLYCLPELLESRQVLVCEGEKAADAARTLGFKGTTSAGGAEAANKTDWRPLAGKEVWILPDNDAAGRKYADSVAGILAKLTPAPTVRIVKLPCLARGGDIVEWTEAHGDAAEPDDLRRELEAIAADVEPATSVADDTKTEAFKPLPVDILPEPVRGFVAAGAEAIGCDTSYLALPLLTELAAAIGNTRRLELKRGWYAPPIIWVVIIGESGSAKTPAFKLVMRPIRERQRKALERHAEAIKQYEADLAHWEKAYGAWNRDQKAADDPPPKPELPQCVRYIVSDTTVEALAPILLSNPRGLLLSRDELNGWIGSFDRYTGKAKGGSDSANWLSMFNAENVIVDRKTGSPKTIFLPQAAMCVCGGIQPGILHLALGSEHRESGLAARLLLTWPPRKAKKWTDADIDPKSEAELSRLVDRLLDLQPTRTDDGETRPVLVRLTPEAKAAWIAYFEAHALEQADLTGDLSAAWSKLEEYAARLALVVHYTRWAAGDVSDELSLDADSMKAGIVLATWFKGEARRVYAMLGDSEGERDRHRLIAWISRKGGAVTVREVQQGCRWLKETGSAEAALEGLVKVGKGSWEPSPRGQRGQPTRRFKLSTPTTVYGNAGHCKKVMNTVDVDAI